MNRKRLTYESLRDSLLFVSGQLSLEPAASAGKPVRTMFEPIERSKANDMRAMFDGPDPKDVTSERADTTTAPQALFMLNNKLVIEAADRLAETLVKKPDLKTDEARLDYAYRRVIGRPPAPREKEIALEYIRNSTWSNYLHVLLCTNEFIYLD
jgi:hypothetical protein